MEPTTPNPDPTTPPEAPSLVGRMTNIVLAPTEVFDDLRARPHVASNWLAPVLIFMLLSSIGASLWLFQPWAKEQAVGMQEKGLQQQVAKGKMTAEQAEQARGVMEKFAVVGLAVQQYAGPVFAGFAGVFFWGLILWLLGRLAFKAPLEFMKACEIAGLATVIDALASLIRHLLILLKGNSLATLGPVLLLPGIDPTQPLHLALMMVDVGALWSLAIMALGLARVCNRPITLPAIVILVIWAARNALFLGLGLLAQKLGGG